MGMYQDEQHIELISHHQSHVGYSIYGLVNVRVGCSTAATNTLSHFSFLVYVAFPSLSEHSLTNCETRQWSHLNYLLSQGLRVVLHRDLVAAPS